MRILAAKVGIVFVAVSWSGVSSASFCESGFRELSVYDAQVLGKRVYAVHATDFFPEGGLLRAGAAKVTDKGRTLAEEPPSFRPTLHFSLGELVRSHASSWESMPYAVILPVGALKRQLINVNTYDSFILGDLRLPEGTVIVVPKGYSGKIPPGIRIETYGDGASLRSAVDQVIEKSGGWPIRMLDGQSPSLDRVAEIDGHSVNTPRFFDSLLKENANLSFGDHMRSQVGSAYRFGNIEAAVVTLMRQYRGGQALPTEMTSFLKGWIEHHLSRLELERKLGRLPKEGLESLDQKVVKLREWLRIVDLDMELRARGRSLAGLGQADSDRLSRLRGDPAALRHFALSELGPDRLGTRVPSGLLDPAIISDYLASVPPEEAREILARVSKEKVLGEGELRDTLVRYSMKRLMLVDRTSGEAEELLRIFDTNLRSGRVKSIFDILTPYLDRTSARRETALRMLEHPSIRKLLEAEWRVSVPESGLTLEGLIRTHPETRALFKAPPSMGSPPSPILERLGLIREPISENRLRSIRSFESARSEAMGVEAKDNAALKAFSDIRRPMTDTQDLRRMGMGSRFTVYERLRRGDFGTLDQFWQRLGLQTEFRKTFPTDDGFWSSSESLAGIHERLARERN